jgi:hypothetical protein
MNGDVGLVSAVITGVGVLLPVAAGALRRSGVLGTIERLRKEQAVVQIVRQQHCMAALPLPPGSELLHSMDDGPRLIVRSGAVDTEGEVEG